MTRLDAATKAARLATTQRQIDETVDVIAGSVKGELDPSSSSAAASDVTVTATAATNNGHVPADSAVPFALGSTEQVQDGPTPQPNRNSATAARNRRKRDGHTGGP